METTRYFRFRRQQPDRKNIQDAWIEQAIQEPTAAAIQRDGRIQRWVYVESEAKYLGVVLLEDGSTVHRAFFDRRFKP